MSLGGVIKTSIVVNPHDFHVILVASIILEHSIFLLLLFFLFSMRCFALVDLSSLIAGIANVILEMC